MPIARDPSATIDNASSHQRVKGARDEDDLALMIAWAPAEPHRVGEVALFEGEGTSLILGRGEDGKSGRVMFVRQRPGLTESTGPLVSPGISREQLRIRVETGRLLVERIGRCALLVSGEPVDRASIEPGDTLLLKHQMLFYCTRRPRKIPNLRAASFADGPRFGEPDQSGMVGESPAAWGVRDQVAWLAQTGEHVLLLGASGAGKELAARGIHALSARAKGPFVARNAATIPAGLADAELFGNIKGYPNPGMPERPGLIGAADGGTLFLDEIGELPLALQANLLRVLDEGGEYHVLGGASAKRSRFRLIGATNRDPSALKHDLAARLVLRLALPDLDARRDDIPLLARHLLRRAARKSPDAMGPFLGDSPDPRVKASLIDHLLHARYTTNARELDAMLWQAMYQSKGDAIEHVSDEGGEHPSSSGVMQTPYSGGPDPDTLDRDEAPLEREPTEGEVRASLDASGGNVVRAAKALGLSSRYALYRLMRKYGIDAGKARGE